MNVNVTIRHCIVARFMLNELGGGRGGAPATEEETSTCSDDFESPGAGGGIPAIAISGVLSLVCPYTHSSPQSSGTWAS